MPKSHKRRRAAGEEPQRDKSPEVQAAALVALVRERDKVRTTRQGEKRRAEFAGPIDTERAKLARIREQQGREIPAESTGLADQHEEVMMTFARANDVVMMWRPVNVQAAAKLAGQYLAEGELVGQYKGKALNTKGKSSVYPAISADIPLDVRLSKVQPEDFAKFQEKNNSSVQSSRQTLEHYRKRFADTLGQHYYAKLPDLVREANEEKIVVPIDKTDADGSVVFYVVHNANDSVYRDGGNVPIFVMQKEQELFGYDAASGQYDQVLELPPHHHLKPVQILAYVQFVVSPEGKAVTEEIFPITADYDELSSIGRKIYPFLNNEEGIRTRVSSDLHKKLAHHGTNPVDPKEVVASVVLEYELQQKRDHRNQQVRKGMGVVNELQWASKVFLKGETDEATSHGPEVNNPFPEVLSDDRYPVHLPNGQIQILHNEQEICDFINALRKEGFPLDVNPKWGWIVDGEGDLAIPEKKFNWAAVHDGLREQQLEMADLEHSEEEGATKALAGLTARHVDDLNLMDMKLKIEKLKLESDIIYSQVVDNTGREPEEDAEEKAFRLAVEKEVRRAEKEVREGMIGDLEERYGQARQKYFDKYGTISLVDEMEGKISGIHRMGCGFGE